MQDRDVSTYVESSFSWACEVELSGQGQDESGSKGPSGREKRSVHQQRFVWMWGCHECGYKCGGVVCVCVCLFSKLNFYFPTISFPEYALKEIEDAIDDYIICEFCCF